MRASPRGRAAASPPFLTGIRRIARRAPGPRFPWSLPLLRDLTALDFHAPVTFLVGENGCGKSTLLEGLAMGMRAVAIGSHDLSRDATLGPAREFAAAYRFQRLRAPRMKAFLRAEDVFGFTRRVTREMAEMRQIEGELAETLPEGAGRARAVGAASGQRRALAARYGENPDGRSHGETFLGLLQTRLAPDGLYFLDEPETPLSPVRVLALIAVLRERVAKGCQLIIATHSPILMALPGAEILLLEDGKIRPVTFEETEHVQITRAFLTDPGSFLRRL